ncbi:phospholipase D-like domain-containing protein [Candidatus Nitrotoga arctica]|uniref:phospholipase D n=1 Tax=Candidatus Nitrotoga arctica TaxID=453162 RepID=A0ABN8AM95_9PROT|nr:phospholipase D-like domain-containing protein [Candidatus Nitrotoga arctica]CAG9933958.1 PLD phosphodiesterase domain-containing protein [Candidatus Nitrotoga arctica]
MRITKKLGKLTVQAVAGTHVVLLGWSMTKADSRRVLGFAVHRTDHTEDEAYWLEGIKVFAETDPGTDKASLRSHPVQGFTWSDFTAKPGYDYTYRVVALKGSPKSLIEEDEVEVRVQTEKEDNGLHEVWFNRGAAASQEYARRFQNQSPEIVGKPAFDWLSRGLMEALLEFLLRAKNSQWALRVAAYQFTNETVLKALKSAKDRGVDVSILYDGRDEKVSALNKAAVLNAGIDSLCRQRTANPSAIAHNKFIVLLKDNQPQAVWTGSTNITDGGIFGHSNVGHVVNDMSIASSYHDYWNLLAVDPKFLLLRPGVETLTPTPDLGSSPRQATSALFSPRSGLKLLSWYAEQAAAAQSMLCMTFAFGINKAFVPVFDKPFSGLRYALLDNDGNRPEPEAEVLRLRKLPFNRFAIGSLIRVNCFDKWLKEGLSGLNSHVPYIHTKFMLVDPLGSNPIVISGSANFSDPSTNANDENMLVIQGNTTVADIYLTEFFRLWNHYAFREWLAKNQGNPNVTPQFLKVDDTWRNIYFGNTEQSRQRVLFSGATS